MPFFPPSLGQCGLGLDGGLRVGREPFSRADSRVAPAVPISSEATCKSCPCHLAGLFLPDTSPLLPAQSASVGGLLILLNLSRAAKSQDPGRQHPSSNHKPGRTALLSPQGLSAACSQLFINNMAVSYRLKCHCSNS